MTIVARFFLAESLLALGLCGAILGQTTNSILAKPSGAKGRVANAEQLKVFGIELASNLRLPECRKRYLGIPLIVPEACFQIASEYLKREISDIPDRPAPKEGDILIHFPTHESPDILAQRALSAFLLNGRIEKIGFSTKGVETQAQIMRILKQKYGDSTAILPVSLKNLMGASFESFTASWTFTNLLVTFHGAIREIDYGYVEFETPVYTAYKDEQEKSKQKGKRQL